MNAANDSLWTAYEQLQKLNTAIIELLGDLQQTTAPILRTLMAAVRADDKQL